MSCRQLLKRWRRVKFVHEFPQFWQHECEKQLKGVWVHVIGLQAIWLGLYVSCKRMSELKQSHCGTLQLQSW